MYRSGPGFGRRRIAPGWFQDPNSVDGYQAQGVQWPVETRRYAYMAPLGGFSSDLEGGTIGLHEQALEENTELEPGDAVTVSVFEGAKPFPILLRPTFTVTAVDFEMPDAYLHTTEGQPVLSAADTDRAFLERTQKTPEALKVVLNGVLACRMREASA